jgi:lysozyme
MLFGKTDVQKDLFDAMVNSGVYVPDFVGLPPKESIQDVFKTAVLSIRDKFAEAVSGLPFIGKKLANVLSTTNKYKENEDDELLTINGNQDRSFVGKAYDKTKYAVRNSYTNAKDKVTSIFNGSKNIDMDELTKDTGSLNGIINSPDVIERLKHHIMTHEGVAFKKYPDSKGNPTIGIGHLIKPGDNFADRLTDIEIKQLFESDLRSHAIEASSIPGFNKLSDVRKSALIDMVFNMGLPTVNTFKNSLQYLRNGEYELAAENILLSDIEDQIAYEKKSNPKASSLDRCNVLVGLTVYTSLIRSMLIPIFL